MIETYIFKTLTSFIALNASLHITKKYWLKLVPKRNGFIKRNIYKLMWCLIPVVRWVFVLAALIIGIALSNEDFFQKYVENLKENKKNE